jgi:hypothetical protein
LTSASRRVRRLLVVAALLVIAVVAIAVQYGRLGGQPQQPAALPSDAPPLGVGLFFVRDTSSGHTLIAYDWSGTRRGSVKLPLWVDASRVRPAPDGSGFMLDPSFSGDYAAYFDRVGRTLLEIDDPAFTAQIWAADNRHVCVLSSTTAGPTLTSRLPGTADRVVAFTLPEDLAGAQLGLLACNLSTDTALLEAEAGSGPHWVVLILKISTGSTVGRVDLGSGGTPVASRDGNYLTIGAAGGAASTRIYRTADLSRPAVVLDTSLIPAAFSADDSFLLAASEADGSLQVVDWKQNRTVWRYKLSGSSAGPWVAGPSGADFAILVGPTGGAGTVVLARRDGETITVPSRELVAG